MGGKIQSNSCKWLADYLLVGICKFPNYDIQIIKK